MLDVARHFRAINPLTSARRRLAIPAWAPVLAVTLIGLVLRFFLTPNADVAWDLTLADKWLDGARLYVDVIEINPPASVFLYVVPAALARWLHVDAAAVVDGCVFLAIAGSIWLTQRILRDAKVMDGAPAWTLLTLTAIALGILPAQSFGEREHIALITLLPLLAVNWVRASRAAPSFWMVSVAGAGAGVTAIIKPYFALAILCSGLMAARSARSWRVLFAPENLIAAVALAIYAGIVWFEFSAFIDMLPLLATVYFAAKLPLVAFLLNGSFVLMVLLLYLLWRTAGRELSATPTSILLAAAAGFAIAFAVQRKGWPYHGYPMLALAWVALGHHLLTSRPQRPAGLAVAAVVSGIMFFWFNASVDRTALAASIRAMMGKPTILALSDDLSIGHPATRQAGGTWVGRVPTLWITDYVNYRLGHETLDAAAVAALKAYAARDRDMLMEDIVRNKPDLILAQVAPEGSNWLQWARSDPGLAKVLEPYRPARTVGDVLILYRASPAHLAAP